MSSTFDLEKGKWCRQPGLEVWKNLQSCANRAQWLHNTSAEYKHLLYVCANVWPEQQRRASTNFGYPMRRHNLPQSINQFMSVWCWRCRCRCRVSVGSLEMGNGLENKSHGHSYQLVKVRIWWSDLNLKFLSIRCWLEVASDVLSGNLIYVCV